MKLSRLHYDGIKPDFVRLKRTIATDEAQMTVLKLQQGVTANVMCSKPRIEVSGSCCGAKHFDYQLTGHQLQLDGHEQGAFGLRHSW